MSGALQCTVVSEQILIVNMLRHVSYETDQHSVIETL